MTAWADHYQDITPDDEVPMVGARILQTMNELGGKRYQYTSDGQADASEIVFMLLLALDTELANARDDLMTLHQERRNVEGDGGRGGGG